MAFRHRNKWLERLEPSMRWPMGAVLIVLVISGALHKVAAQQPSCVGVIPAAGPTGYARRSGSERCEGIYLEKVAGGGVDLVSLTQGKLVYRLDLDSTVFIRSPGPGLVLLGQGIPSGTLYRLSAPLPWPAPASFKLPLGDVLRPWHIDSGDLGLLAVRKSGTATPVYVPVRATAAENTLTVLSPPPIATLRAEETIRNLRWRLSFKSQPPGQWTPLPGAGLVRAGWRGDLELPMLAEDTSGSLEFQYEDSQGESYLVSFALAGR